MRTMASEIEGQWPRFKLLFHPFLYCVQLNLALLPLGDIA